MKKKIILTLLATFIVILSKADDTQISFDGLPEKARKFIQTHFQDSQVSYVEFDQKDNDYEVKLIPKAEISFDGAGNWKKIDSRKMPQSITKELPQPMVDYLNKNYSMKSVSEIKRWNNGYEVEISKTFGDVDLYFDEQGKFVRKDK